MHVIYTPYIYPMVNSILNIQYLQPIAVLFKYYTKYTNQQIVYCLRNESGITATLGLRKPIQLMSKPKNLFCVKGLLLRDP